MRSFSNWLGVLLSGEPHFYIGGRQRPYLLRWYLIPRNRWLNIYLHKFLRDDDDRALHDHPWWFVSVMLWGSYIETRDIPVRGDGFQTDKRSDVLRSFPSIAFRLATDRHRVALPKDDYGRPVPCWTLVITGPKVREWGFHCPKGFVPWHKFIAVDDPGSVGPGCGDA